MYWRYSTSLSGLAITFTSGEQASEEGARPNFGTAHFKVSHLGLGAAVSDYDGWQEEKKTRRGKGKAGRRGKKGQGQRRTY